MFTTFNTVFYGGKERQREAKRGKERQREAKRGKERLVLSKHKIDILHKDRAYKHTCPPAHFAMTLHLQPRDAEATASKARRVAN